MFLYAPPTHYFTSCPSTPSPREQYIDALAKFRAAEASYLTFRAAEREEEALTRRLRELQLRRQKDRLHTLGQYFSGNAYLTGGLNDFGTYQEDYPYIIGLAGPQASKAGHNRCCCDNLASSMCPCMCCSDASGMDLHPDNVDHFTGMKLPLAKSQPFIPTPSISGYRRGARSFRRPHPSLQNSFFMGCYGLRDEEQLKNIQSHISLCQTSSSSKQYPHEIPSDDKSSTKRFDAPTTPGHQTNGSMQRTPETVPSRAETPHGYNIPDSADFANIFQSLPSASSEPHTETTRAPERESKPVSVVPAEDASTEGGLDIPVSTISSANPSTADLTTETASSTDTASSTETSSTETTFSTEITSFDKIRTIEATFNALKENFTLPGELDFLRSTPSAPSTPSMTDSESDTESASATDHLTYSPRNRSVRSYEQALTVLLEQLDGVDSLGDEDVRKSRREVVKRIELALEELEREVDGQWRIRVSEALVNEGKLGGAVLGLGLKDYENEQEDNSHKQDHQSDGPFPEAVEQNDPSPANFTVNSSDDLSAQVITTPVHDNNPVQAPLEDQLKFSDTAPVVETSADYAADSVPSPVPIASTTNFSVDAEPGPSIFSASAILEPTPITTPNANANANAITRDGELSIPVNIPAKFPVQPFTPSLLEASSPTSENVGLTTLQGADIESEGFFLPSSGADESVSEHPIFRDSGEEWLEVDA